ncbi:CDP-glycerol glycerophosphotransferase family protein [Butyrivibrio sp. INlla21]|uniref:CDP-glycerol glycerophosphotransferase family protein n=1 Tax=Butyrivibrio sp. INlla21 TaxID=1520811 RepID=UPI0008E2E240|nr:CDP-glycerol glycerophosphotransferase family protein [Butyrivibrio sp. INlla21]SFV03802.1 CDP-glycerol glycerophosphotransferase [Butyrivibrio sp. INlla21]
MFLDDKVSRAKEIIVYGAGSVADLLYAYLSMNSQQKKIRAFAVTNTNGAPLEKHDIPVISVTSARVKYPDALLIIAVHEKTVAAVLKTATELGFKQYIIGEAKELRRNLYHELYKYPLEKNKIFMMNYHGGGYGCNPKYIAEQLIKKDIDNELDIVWGVTGANHHFPERIRTVQIGTYDYYKELATSGIWIDNVRKTDEVEKREGQYYIQTWHGAAPFKKVEGDLEGRASEAIIEMGKRDSGMVDLFISGSEFYSKLYRDAFWYSGEILESGLPRQDVFWNGSNVIRKVRNNMNISDNKLIVLYAPTFRDDGNTDYYNLDLCSVKEAIRERFGKECVVCVSKHPLNNHIDYAMDKTEYIDVSIYDDFEEILATTDVLITDYSGCIYDYSFSGNPAFLYQPDLQQMKERRDFYVAPDKMPYPSACDMNGLTDIILNFDECDYANKLSQFMSEFGNYDDGKASERVCERIYSIIK